MQRKAFRVLIERPIIIDYQECENIQGSTEERDQAYKALSENSVRQGSLTVQGLAIYT